MFQRKSLILIGVSALFALLWTAGWFWIADRFEGVIHKFAESRQADGVEIVWRSIRITGFPIRFDTHIEGARGIWTTPERDIAWTGPDIVLRPFVDEPGAGSFRAPGQHRFDVRTGTGEVTVRVLADDFRGRVEVGSSRRGNALRGRAEPLTIEVENGATIRTARTAFDWMRMTGDTAPEAIHPDTTGHAFTLAIDGIDLSSVPLDPQVTNLFGTTMDRLAGRLALRGDLEPGGIDTASLTRWRDAGGTLEAENFELVWGPLRIAGNGTVGLDGALQPVGAFAAEISGLDTLLDLLENRGDIRPQQAAIARIALAVLTRPSGNGNEPVANVPVTVQNRVLSVGPVPLLTLEPIVWN